MKKILAILLALVMVFGMASTVSAADETYTLTIVNSRTGHTYEAYQIFAGDMSGDKTTLSNVKWGTSITDGAALLAALKADSQVGSIFSAATDAAKVAEILGTVSNDSANLDRFAEIVENFLKATPVGTSGAQSDGKYVISNLPVGYYLVKDKDETQDGKDDFYTKLILELAKNQEVQVKGGNVIVDKTINDTVDGTYTEYESFDINQDVFYKWDGSLPSNLRAYETYYYKFVDTLPAGITFVELEAAYIEDQNGQVVHTFSDLENIAVDTKLNGTNATALDDITFDVEAKNNDTPENAKDDYQVISLEFMDLKTLVPSLLSTDKVIVKYRAYLDRDALIEKGNENNVILIYDNNPNGEGHGQTPEDPAYAFTFEFKVDKYDQADINKKLEGVEFLLYYRTHDAEENIVLNYAKVVTEEMIAEGAVINDKVVQPADLGLVYGWTTNKADASVLDTDAEGSFYVKGLDAGTYFLEETKTVDGYNLLETPVQIDIVPTYTGEEISGYDVVVEYRVDSISQGENDTVGIRNSKGSTLPTTGGMGTTIFYVLGSVMILGAAILLITKKRMSAEA